MQYQIYINRLKENFRLFRSININAIIFLYSLFIWLMYKSGGNVFEALLTSNVSEIWTRIAFVSIFILSLIFLNLILIWLSFHKKRLEDIKLVSLFLSSFVFFSSYILISTPELLKKFSMISMVIAIGFLVYLYSELKHFFYLKYNKSIFENFGSSKIRLLSIVVVALYVVYFSALSVIAFLTFESPTHDTGIFVNILHNISKFRSAYCSIYDMNFFEHHFSPVLYLLVPFYWLYPSPITILVLQSIALGVASIFLFKLAKCFTKNNLFAFFLQVSYLLHPAVHGTNLFDFHEVAFLPLFLFGAFYYYEKGAIKLYWVFFILALMVKEDVPIFLAIFGVYIGLIRSDKKTGIITLLVSVIYYLALKQFLVHGVLFSRYNEMMIPGVDPEKGIVLTLLTNPVYILDFVISNNQKIAFVIIMCLPLLFLPFRSGYALILLIPSFIYGLMTNYEMHFRVNFHNPLPFIPVLYYLAVLSTSKLKANTTYIGILILISSIAANTYFGSFDPTLKPILSKMRQESKREIINSVISKIPPEASVTANVQIVPNLSMRDSIFTFPFLMFQDTEGKLFYEKGKAPKYSLTNNASYILWDNKYSWIWPFSLREQGFRLIQQIASTGKYGLLYSYGGVYLLKKGYSTAKNFQLKKYYSICLSREFGQELPDKDSETGFNLLAKPSDINGIEKYLTWGPYTTLSSGKYNVRFCLKIDNNSGNEEIASIEIYRHPDNYMATKTIKASDFILSGKFQIFSLPIEVPTDLDNIEFRILYKGKRNLWVDYILQEKVN